MGPLVVDIIVAVLLIAGLLYGLTIGIVRIFVGAVVLAVAIILTLYLRSTLEFWQGLERTVNIALSVGVFVVLWIFISMLGVFIANLLQGGEHPGGVNRILGGLFGLVFSLLLVSLLYVMALWIPENYVRNWKQDSRTLGFVERTADWSFSLISALPIPDAARRHWDSFVADAKNKMTLSGDLSDFLVPPQERNSSADGVFPEPPRFNQGQAYYLDI